MKVILDTNFLVIPEEKKIDIFTEIKKKEPNTEFIILKSIKREIEQMDTKASKIAEQLIKKKDVKVVETQSKKEHTDDQIVDYAERENTAVATNDKELKKRCWKKEIPVIFLRSGKKIDIIR